MKRHQNPRTHLPSLIFFITVLLLTGPVHSWGASAGTGKLLDMTYPFDENTIYWPTAEPFKLEKLVWGAVDAGWWYASNNYGASEHGGTHVDAPCFESKVKG